MGAAAYSKFIFEEADLFNVSPELVAALVLQESDGIEDAFRFEKGFKAKYLDSKSCAKLGGHWPHFASPAFTEEQERVLRSCSFGLCQIMGQVAREYGFKHDNLFDLFVPETNIHFGVMKLATEIDKARFAGSKRPEWDGLLGYNGGGSVVYPDKVLGRIRNGTAKLLLHDS